MSYVEVSLFQVIALTLHTLVYPLFSLMHHISLIAIDFYFQNLLAPLSTTHCLQFLFFIVVICAPYSSFILMLIQTAFPVSGVRAGDGEGEALSSLPDFGRSIRPESDAEFDILSSCKEIFQLVY